MPDRKSTLIYDPGERPPLLFRVLHLPVWVFCLICFVSLANVVVAYTAFEHESFVQAEAKRNAEQIDKQILHLLDQIKRVETLLKGRTNGP